MIETEVLRTALFILGMAMMVGGFITESWSGGGFVPYLFWSGWLAVAGALFLFHWAVTFIWIGAWGWFLVTRRREE